MKKTDYINIANILTFSRMILGVIFFILFLVMKLNNFDKTIALILEIVSFFVFLIAIITDGLDGYFARRNDKVTDFGKHFDPLSDSIFFIMVFFTFFYISLMPLYLFMVIVLREGTMHLFLRPYVKSKGFSLPANIYGKVKMFFQCMFSIIILTAIIFGQILNLISFTIPNYNIIVSIMSLVFFIIITLLSVSSFIIYLFNLKNVLKK